MTNRTHFKHNDDLSIPVGNLVEAEAFKDRFGLDEAIHVLETKGTNFAKIAEDPVKLILYLK